MSSTKLQILKEKLRRIIEDTDDAKRDFLTIVSCHKGSIMPDSIHTSFRRFKEKYGDQKFTDVKKYLMEEGIILIPKSPYQHIQFSVKDEKGEYDSQHAEELPKFFGKLILKHEAKIREALEELLKEPEGGEFLRCIATQRGIHIRDGVEPKIKEIIGKQSYESILNKLVELGVMNEYAFSSKKHGYTGYKLLPYIDDYIKSKLGIFELEEIEKDVLTYIGCANKIFNNLTKWYIWFSYPSEYNHKILATCTLAQKFFEFLTYRTEEDVNKTIDELKGKGLINQVDLGYRKGGYFEGCHKGIVLELSQSGRKIATQEENKLIEKVENKIKEIFSDKDNQVIYHLFSQEKIPLRILSLIKANNVDILRRTGLIGEESSFIQFKKGSSLYEYIHSGLDPEEIRKWLKEKCESILSKEEKQLLGFLSECKTVVLGKYPDWKSWSLVTSRTQRNYQSAYESIIINFRYLEKLFSYITNLAIDETETIARNLEKNGFLLQRNDSGCGFPGYATVYQIPIRFAFDFDLAPLKSKIENYLEFLFENFEQNHNQIIFLDYLPEFYDEENFLVRASVVKDLLEFLNYVPQKQYLPIYFFEDGNVILHPCVKECLKQEILKLKSKTIEPIKTLIHELAQKYREDALYNYREDSTKDGYYIIHIESPDPSTGIVSFVLTPWMYVTDMEKINKLYERSNTVNLFVIYPNYPQLRKILSEVNKSYNLFIIRQEIVYTWIQRLDSISHSFLVQLNKQLKITEVEKLSPTKGQEIGIGVIEEIPIAIGQMNKAENVLEKWFKKLQGRVIAMLDYIDKSTFGYVDSIPKECSIQIITSHIKDKDRCKIKAEKSARDRPFFEIMEINKVHERWIGSESSFVIEIGTDLKSDAIGNTNHTIRVLKPEAYKETIKRFYEFWNESQKELRRVYGSKLVKTLCFSSKKWIND